MNHTSRHHQHGQPIATSHPQPRHPLCLDHGLRRAQKSYEPEFREARPEIHSQLAADIKRFEELEGKNWQSKADSSCQTGHTRRSHRQRFDPRGRTSTRPKALKALNARREWIDLLSSTPVLSDNSPKTTPDTTQPEQPIHPAAQPCRLERDVPSCTSQAPAQQDASSLHSILMWQLKNFHDNAPYLCHDCPTTMGFETLKDLNQHRKSIHGKAEYPYENPMGLNGLTHITRS